MGTRRAVVERHLSEEELRAAIKQADDRKVVRRLCFVSNLYAGDTIEEAARRVGASQGTGSEWLSRWNEAGLRGLIPRFGAAAPRSSPHSSHGNCNASSKKDNPGPLTRSSS